MKINKNVVLEYLYLTIFVITLFVLKELIEYVFFTRKRNNVIEKFSTPCNKIGWYYREYDNIKKTLDNISLIYATTTDTIPQQIVINCDGYTEIKTVTDIAGTAGKKNYSRIVIEPSSTAIYFEKLVLDSTGVETTVETTPVPICYAIKIKTGDVPVTLDFIKYTYTDAAKPDYDSTNNSCSFDSNRTDGEEIFARFDTAVTYTESINEKIQELMNDH